MLNIESSWPPWRKISRYFNDRNNIANWQEDVPMTTSKYFEQTYIIFSTMKKNKLTTKEEKGYLFIIECYMPSFEPQNQSVCNWHASTFKNDKYMFNPWKDLVLSMPYQFVANLEPGKFTPLDNRWLKNLKKFFKKVKLNSIKQIRLVRLLRTNYIGNVPLHWGIPMKMWYVKLSLTPMVHIILSILIKFMKTGYMAKLTAFQT